MDEHNKLVAALKEVINDANPDGIVLIKRIPLICQDIATIKTNIEWLKWLIGAVFLGMLAVFWASFK